LDLDLVHHFPDDGGHLALLALSKKVKADEAVVGMIQQYFNQTGLLIHLPQP